MNDVIQSGVTCQNMRRARGHGALPPQFGILEAVTIADDPGDDFVPNSDSELLSIGVGG